MGKPRMRKIYEPYILYVKCEVSSFCSFRDRRVCRSTPLVLIKNIYTLLGRKCFLLFFTVNIYALFELSTEYKMK